MWDNSSFPGPGPNEQPIERSQLALIVEGDNDQDDGFKFLAEIFGIALRDGRLGVGELDFIAVGVAAGLFDNAEDLGNKGPRVFALVNLLERIGKAGIERDEIDRLFPEPEKGDKGGPEGSPTATPNSEAELTPPVN